MEIHANAFSYISDSAYINNTTFYEFDLIYKYIEPLYSTYVGLWIDPDLGCHVDDYIGCIKEERMGIVYNGDDFDEEICAGGIKGYGEDIPVLAVKVMRALEASDGTEAPFAAFTYYLNGSYGDPLPVQEDPSQPADYYNYLTGKWKDGTPFSKGGDAYNSGEPAYPFAFDGSEIAGEPWTECNAGTPPGDRRMILSFGPIDLMPGERRKLAFAVVWKPNQPHPCPGLSSITEDAIAAETYYFEQSAEMVSNTEYHYAAQPSFQLAPNPFTDYALLSLKGISSQIKDVRLFTIQGQMVRHYQNVNQNSLRIEREGLENGLYLVQLTTDSEEVLTKRLIIHQKK